MTDENITNRKAQDAATNPHDQADETLTGEPGVDAGSETIRSLLTGAAIGVAMFGARTAIHRLTRQPAPTSRNLSAPYRPLTAPSAPARLSPGDPRPRDPETYTRLVRGAFDTLNAGHQLRMDALGKPPGPRMF